MGYCGYQNNKSGTILKHNRDGGARIALMRHRWFIAAVGAIPVLILAGVCGWRWVTGPMYSPGDARELTLEPPPQTAPGLWTVEPGIKLQYFSSGEGRNVLVVHGGPGIPTRDPWPGLELLKDRFRFHYYDQRGCGGSTRPFDRFDSGGFSNTGHLERTLGLAAQVADIERIRRILGDEKLVLIGHSFGGLIAALYAAEFPERVGALVLVAPATLLVMPARDGNLYENIRSRLPAAQRAAYDAWLTEYMNFRTMFAKTEKQLAAEHLRSSEFLRAVTGQKFQTPAHIEDAGGWVVRALYLSLGSHHNWRKSMRAVAAPVLVLHGENDLQPETATRLWAFALPTARFDVISDCSHFPHIENPATFAAALRRFLLKEN